MRFAGQAITIPSVRQNPEVLPSTEGVRYPEDNQPAGEFNGGEGVDPTYLPQMRQQYMQSPQGGIAQLAPQMTDPWVENSMIQDYDSPYLVTPDIKRLRRGSMNQFIDNPEVLKRTFKGV